MDHINDLLTNWTRDDDTYEEPIRVALGLAKKTLNRYYKISDMFAVYRIAMILHPCYKVDYFKSAHWPKAWQKDTRKMVEEEYSKHYAPSDDDAASAPHTRRADMKGPSESQEGNIFDHLPSMAEGSGKHLEDELQQYLDSPTVFVKPHEALSWWTEQAKRYPNLSCMARDYLSIPATSVDVERTFSRGCRLLSHVRSRLSAQTTRAVLCVGDWSRLDLIKTDDVCSVTAMPDVKGDESDYEMEDGWERISSALAARA
ncbi:hypothetical protein VTO73DRAFT_7143 [Trametes versicolor]